MRYTQHSTDAAGWTEWFIPKQGDTANGGSYYRMGCCDCGLVHDLDFDIVKGGRVRLRARRNERATAAKRRHRKPSR